MFGNRCEHRLRKRPLGRYRYVRLRWRVLFSLIDLVGSLVFRAARALRRSGQSDGDNTDPRGILLVQLDHMGDAILTTGMLGALRDRYGQARIEVLCGAWNRELFEAMPEVDRVYVSHVNRFARAGRLGWPVAMLWWGWMLRRRGIIDLAIDVRGEFPLALLLWLCGARRRLGWDCGGGGFLLTDSPRFVPDRPEVESRAALLAELGLAELGIRPSGVEPLRPVFHPSRQARASVARQLAELPPPDGLDGLAGGRLVVHVSAGTAAKQWPVEHWRELIARVIVRHGSQIVLVGSPDDRIIARQILAGRPWPGVVDWTGRLGVVELAALLEQADVLVGADSGPAHLAAAVGTPVVVLFSGTNSPRQWQPSGTHVTVLRHAVPCNPCHRTRCPLTNHPCMSRLRPDVVAEEVGRVFSRRACQPNRLAADGTSAPSWHDVQADVPSAAKRS